MKMKVAPRGESARDIIVRIATMIGGASIGLGAGVGRGTATTVGGNGRGRGIEGEIKIRVRSIDAGLIVVTIATEVTDIADLEGGIRTTNSHGHDQEKGAGSEEAGHLTRGMIGGKIDPLQAYSGPATVHNSAIVRILPARPRISDPHRTHSGASNVKDY